MELLVNERPDGLVVAKRVKAANSGGFARDDIDFGEFKSATHPLQFASHKRVEGRNEHRVNGETEAAQIDSQKWEVANMCGDQNGATTASQRLP